MNSIRTAVPNQPTRTCPAAARLAQASAVFAVVLFGAISCSDLGTQPAAPVGVVFDSAGSMEGKLQALQADDFSQPSASISPSQLRPLSSASAAGAPSYGVSSISHAPEVGPFTKTYPRCDDCAFVVDLGFNFNFFGVDYSRLWISSNGHVTFQPSVFPHGYYGGYARGYPIPNPDAASDNPVNNVIGLAWADLSTLNGGAISHVVRGEPGKRRLIVNFAAVPVVLEESRKVTVQLILREGSNEIEIHTTSKPATSHYFTQGIENKDGTEAHFVPGRVAARWSLANDAVRFAPPAVQNRAPVANAGGNAGRYEGTEGTAIQFVGSGSDADNDALTFSWDFNGDGVADATSAQASHTYADNGAHSAVLTVKDGRGGVGQARVDVVVRNAEPVVNAGSDVRVNAGESVGFSGQFSDKGVKDAPWRWTWDLGSYGSYSDNTESQAAAILGSKRFCKAGTFPVKLTVVDKDGGSGSDELVVTVDALPVQIDVDPNTINLNGSGHGMITVRIYSRDGLDATALSPDAIRLTNGSGNGTQLARSGGGGRWHWNARADLNGDGRLDVSAGFRRDELIANGDLTSNTTELSLSGEVGTCGDVLGKAPVDARVSGKVPR